MADKITVSGADILGPMNAGYAEILTPKALDLCRELAEK
jgi:hypothetical protein